MQRLYAMQSACKDHSFISCLINKEVGHIWTFKNCPRLYSRPHIWKDVILWTYQAGRTVLQRQIHVHARFTICPITLANFGIIKLARVERSSRSWGASSRVFVISKVRDRPARFRAWQDGSTGHFSLESVYNARAANWNSAGFWSSLVKFTRHKWMVS